MPNSRTKLTEEVKDVARRQGAVLVGVAPVERFEPVPPLSDAAPKGHHPKDFLPETKSVISIAQPILNAVLEAPAVLAEQDMEMIPPHVRYPYMEVFYNRVGHVVHDYMLEFIGQVVGQYLMSKGFRAMIFPTTGLHPSVNGMSENEIWDGTEKHGEAEPHSPLRYTYGPFSHRHAATRAGLGEFGYNNVVLTREFGPRQRFNSILTDADLVPDPLIEEPICLRDNCRLCLEACIMQCISMREIEHDDHNRIFIDTPAKTDPTLCSRRREGRPDSPVRGDCIRVCPVPEVPTRTTSRLKSLLDDWQAR